MSECRVISLIDSSEDLLGPLGRATAKFTFLDASCKGCSTVVRTKVVYVSRDSEPVEMWF